MIQARAFTQDLPDPATLRTWIEDMKSNPRGPFDQIRWFCKDGVRLTPTPGACEPHGGGHQHGQWSERTRALRAGGYRIANFYADLEIEPLLSEDLSFAPLAQMLVEQFLIRADDGWILRQARYYRGAYQEEGERKGARTLLRRLGTSAGWADTRYLFLRTATAMLPHGAESGSVREIRQLSAALSDRIPSFKPLRNKIHGRMSADDAAAVRAYAAAHDENGELEHLARLIDEVFTLNAEAALRSLAAATPADSPLASVLAPLLATWESAGNDPERKTALLADILATLRESITVVDSGVRLQLLDTSLLVEVEYFALLGQQQAAVLTQPRRARLDFVRANIDALFG
ncbi:MAG: hypothetical protein ACREXT_02525, partial [Gammaproteobacteria bacterium]